MWSGTSGLSLHVDVECYAGYRGEEAPRGFGLAEGKIEIAEIVDRWLSPDHRYFKVRDRDGDVYILRNDVASGQWEVTFFQARNVNDDLQGGRDERRRLRRGVV